MAENARADCRGMYSWWWDSHISPKNSKWLCENLRDMDLKVKQMIKIIEEDADSFARRAEMYYERRPKLMKLAEDFYRAYRALAERYGHATGVLRFAHKTMSEAFPDKVKSMPANGRMSVNCCDGSDDLLPEAIDFEIAGLMGLPEGFMSPDSKAGLDVLDGLFDPSGIEKSYFYSCGEAEGLDRAAMMGSEEAAKEAVTLKLVKSLERVTDLESELASVQDSCRRLEERAKEAESEIEQLKRTYFELETLKETHLLEYQKCLSEVEEIRTRASDVESELKKDVVREKAEKEAAFEKFSSCIGMLLNLQKKLQHVTENGGGFETETLDHHLETVEKGWNFAEKLVLDLLLRLDDLVQKMQSKDVEILEKQKDLGRLWTCIQEEKQHRVDVEDSLQKLKTIWFQSQEESRSLFAQIQEKDRLLEDAESRIKCLHEELDKANAASSDLIRHLERKISTDKESLEKLEADSERQSSVLQTVRSIGLDPENLVPSINELYAQFTGIKRTLEQERSERASLRVKLAVLDEFVEKNVLLEVDIFNLETQLDEFRDKVLFLEESCESLLEERSKTTHERDVLSSQFQEEVNQSKKLKEMNCLLETSLLDANSQLQELMLRAKGIKEYMQNADKDHEELQDKYSVLEKEKELLTSRIVQLQIELNMKEECEEELEKSLGDSIDGLFSWRAAGDIEERSSSFLFKLQTLVEAWKFSQVQISYLEHEILVQQSELEFLSDQIDIGKASIHAMLNSNPMKISPEEPFKTNCDNAKSIIQKVHDWHESLSWIEEAYLEASVEKSVLVSVLVQMKVESAEVVADLNKLKIENCHLKELLERSGNAIGEIKSENDLLQCEVLYVKDLLHEMEIRNMKAEKMLKTVDDEKKEMQRKLNNLEMELANANLSKEDQGKQISKHRPDKYAMERNCIVGVNATDDATKDYDKSGTGSGDNDNEKSAETIAFYQPASEISLAPNDFMTKEIVLDQSFGFYSYAGVRTLSVNADDRMLELWETSDASSNIDLKVGKPQKVTLLDDPNFDNESRKNGSVHDHCEEEDSLDEKELGVDNQEISECAAEHRQGLNKRRLLERLNGDAQKLTNLHITLNDLQRMVELILKGGQEQSGEYDAVNAQLEEARITTIKLSEANTKLIKAVDKWFRARPANPMSEAMDDGGSFIRRRISDKARRGSEKVAKLQIEVQKMQFLLLKLGEQKENKGRPRVVDRKPRVLLKDYLNNRLRGGGGGSGSCVGQKQKKGQFFACVHLPNRRN